MMRGGAFVLAGFGLLLAPFGAVRSQDGLPAAPERALVESHCVQCHSQERIEQSEGSESEWRMRIRRMQRRGSDLPQHQVLPLATYLARSLPPRVRAEAVRDSPVHSSVSEVAVRPLQILIRTSGKVDRGTRLRTAKLSPSDAARVRVGQRVRAFALESRSSMLPGRVVELEGGQVWVELRNASVARTTWLLEIIADQGPRLSVANEAIVEEDGRRTVYVQDRAGDFLPRAIETGLEGELYTEVVSGAVPGEGVVTFGSFFIDAEYKMKGARSGSLQISYAGDPDPPRSGPNGIRVSVHGPDDQPVTDGAVSVTCYMPAMPSMGMPEMREVFPLTHQGEGLYAGTATLSMEGTWLVTVTVARGGQTIGSRRLTLIAEH